MLASLNTPPLNPNQTPFSLHAKKLQGVKLGKPKRTIQRSKFDRDLDRITELASLGVSIRKMAAILGYSNHMGLTNYLKRMRIVE